MIHKLMNVMVIGSAIPMLFSLFGQLQRPAPTSRMAMPPLHDGANEFAERLFDSIRPLAPPAPTLVESPPMAYPEGPDWQAWVAAQAARNAARKCLKCGRPIWRAASNTCMECTLRLLQSPPKGAHRPEPGKQHSSHFHLPSSPSDFDPMYHFQPIPGMFERPGP